MESDAGIKLTSLSSKGGCGCKIGPADLMQVIRCLPPALPDPNLLIGLDTSDDAGVYKLSDDLALVQTVDFFTRSSMILTRSDKLPRPTRSAIFMRWAANH